MRFYHCSSSFVEASQRVRFSTWSFLSSKSKFSSHRTPGDDCLFLSIPIPIIHLFSARTISIHPHLRIMLGFIFLLCLKRNSIISVRRKALEVIMSCYVFDFLRRPLLYLKLGLFKTLVQAWMNIFYFQFEYFFEKKTKILD